MDLDMTLEGPKYYTRPFGIQTSLNLLPDTNIIEFVCDENEKDVAHMQKR
jgi:hypothetical protein